MLAPLILPVVAVLGVLPVVTCVAVVVGMREAAKQQERRKDELWRRWAIARDWGYASQWPQMVHLFRSPPFGVGTDRRAVRGFWGRFDSVDVFGFDYSYSQRSGDSRSTMRQFVAGIRFPGARFPELTISREVPFATSRDIQFENDDFNRAWSVNGSSPRFAHDVMHPRAMEYLMGPVPVFQRMWFDGDALLASVAGDPDPLRVDAHLRLLTQFAGLLPSFTLRELGAAGAIRPDLSGPGISMAEQQRRMAAMSSAHVRHQSGGHL